MIFLRRTGSWKLREGMKKIGAIESCRFLLIFPIFYFCFFMFALFRKLAREIADLKEGLDVERKELEDSINRERL